MFYYSDGIFQRKWFKKNIPSYRFYYLILPKIGDQKRTSMTLVTKVQLGQIIIVPFHPDEIDTKKNLPTRYLGSCK